MDMSKKIVKPSTYLIEVKTLSDRIVKAQQPIRILDAIKWDDSIKQEFFKGNCQKPPVITTDYYQNRSLGFDPTEKKYEFYQIERDLVRKLGNFRKNASALKTGKMMHYVPVDGLYVYFRYDENQTIMCVMNTSDTEKEIDFQKYAERTADFISAKNVISEERMATVERITIPAMKMWILELGK